MPGPKADKGEAPKGFLDPLQTQLSPPLSLTPVSLSPSLWAAAKKGLILPRGGIWHSG